MNIAHIDFNNFYVSCERAFQPELENRPVIVLSNNDGCAIARSNEVKALKISMGAPVHQIQDLIKRHNIQIRSANFTLYGDLSDRAMRVIEELTPRMTVYSIDECFVDVTGIPDLDNWIKTLKQTIWQWTGLPASIGVGRTKVLAKLANRLAKKGSGTFLIKPEYERDVLSATPVADIWGVGGQLSARLHHFGIYTAQQLAAAPARLVRDKFTVVMARLRDELNGNSVLAFSEVPEARKQIICSRSFGETATEFEQLNQAIIKFITLGAVKLRKEGSEARLLRVSVNTNHFSAKDKQYHRSAEINLPFATNDTATLIRYAVIILKQLFKENYAYKRAGIMLMDLTPVSQQQSDFFSRRPNPALDQVRDGINRRYGRDSFVPAKLISKNQSWKMRQHYLSRPYTTSWLALPLANA